MATADEIFAATEAESFTEGHIVIGRDRFITVPDSLKRLAVQYDHNIETVTFDCPRYWDEHDMSQMRVYINYLRADKKDGLYKAENVRADETDPEIMHFEWTVSRNVTEVKGNIVFLVCVKKADEEGYEQNHWNSERCTDCYVSEGLEIDSEELLDPIMPDIVEQWEREVTKTVNKATEDLTARADETFAELTTKVDEAIGGLDEAVTNKTAEVDEAIGRLDTAVADKTAEVDAVISNLTTTVDNKLSEVDAKSAELSATVDQAIDDLTDSVDTKKAELTQVVDNKIVEIDNKSAELTETVDRAIGDLTQSVDDKKSELTTAVDNKIAELDNKSVELTDTVDSAISTLTESVDTKISEIDAKSTELTNTVDQAIDELTKSVDDKKAELTTTVDTKISEIDAKSAELTSAVDEAIQNAAETVDKKGEELTQTVDEAIQNLTTTVEDTVTKANETVESVTNDLITARNAGEFDGATFTPSLTAAGDLSWTNNKGLANPATVNIKGNRGDDGVSPTLSVTPIQNGHRITITDANGTQSIDVKNGIVEFTGTEALDEYMRSYVVIGDVEPASGPKLWFDTSAQRVIENTIMLQLDKFSEDYPVAATIGETDYSVTNASEPTETEVENTYEIKIT